MPTSENNRPIDPNVRYSAMGIPLLVGYSVNINAPIDSRMTGTVLAFLRQFIAARLPEGVKSMRARRERPAAMNMAFADVWIGDLTTGKSMVTSWPLSPCTLTRDIFQGSLCGTDVTSKRIPISSKQVLLKRIHNFRKRFMGCDSIWR